MATLLEADLITDALVALPGWKGDPRGLRRSVTLDDDTAAAVAAEVTESADAMDHHPSLDRTGDVTSFTLSTHSAGGVTELDVTLASRISDILRQHGVRPAAAETASEAPADGATSPDADGKK